MDVSSIFKTEEAMNKLLCITLNSFHNKKETQISLLHEAREINGSEDVHWVIGNWMFSV